MITTVAALLLPPYLLGSIPFGYLVARAKGIDIRKVGSGNIGATNVNRALGSKWALLVFAFDVLKGLVPGLVARALVPDAWLGCPAELIWFFAGFAALLGHVFSPWLGFKGGKGIATGLGMMLATAPIVALLAFTVFLLVLLPTRYISLSSIVAAVSLPLVGWFVPGEARAMVPIYTLLAVFIVVKHKDNIRRLRDGTESKFGFKKEPMSRDGGDGAGVVDEASA